MKIRIEKFWCSACRDCPETAGRGGDGMDRCPEHGLRRIGIFGKSVKRKGDDIMVFIHAPVQYPVILWLKVVENGNGRRLSLWEKSANESRLSGMAGGFFSVSFNEPGYGRYWKRAYSSFSICMTFGISSQERWKRKGPVWRYTKISERERRQRRWFAGKMKRKRKDRAVY